MRVLVFSDIHANLAALEAVIEDAAAIGFDKVWCLGDTVGYGPEPDACVARLRELDEWSWWATMTGQPSAGWMSTNSTPRPAAPCSGPRLTSAR